MSELTEIKETIERLADVIYSAGMDEESEELRETVNDLLSLLEEKDKALKKICMIADFGSQIETYAVAALNTTKEEQGNE